MKIGAHKTNARTAEMIAWVALAVLMFSVATFGIGVSFDVDQVSRFGFIGAVFSIIVLVFAAIAEFVYRRLLS